MEKLIWKIKFLWFKYILRHTYTIGVDLGSQDDDCSVIVRRDKKGNRIVEKIFNPPPQNNLKNESVNKII